MSGFSIDVLDSFGYGDSLMHRIDPRAKVLATFGFVVAVVSFNKYELSGLMPFFLLPMATVALGFLPIRLVLNRVLAALPFIVLIGIFNPVFDRAPVMLWDGFQIRAGWISFASILLRGILCVSAAVTLIGTTSFPRFIAALQALKVPDALATQLMLIYRYLFLLIGQARATRRARSLRSASDKTPLGLASSMLVALLNRTLDLAQAVWMAMKARGFDTRLKVTRPMNWRPADSFYLALVAAGSVLFRFWPLGEWLGRMIVTK